MSTLGLRLAACALLAVADAGVAQSLQITPIRLVMGQPAELQLQIRPEGLPGEATPGHTPPRPDRCLELHLESGDTSFGPIELAQINPIGQSDSEVLSVRARTRHPIPEPWLQGRAIWRCGARFVREFMWLVDPPDPQARTAQAVPERNRHSKRATKSPRTTNPAPAQRLQPIAHPDFTRLLLTQQRLEASLLELESRLEAKDGSEMQAQPPAAGVNVIGTRSEVRPAIAGLGELGQGLLIGSLISSVLIGVGWRLGQRGQQPVPQQTPLLAPSPPKPRPVSARAHATAPEPSITRAKPPASNTPTQTLARSADSLSELLTPKHAVTLETPADMPFDLERIDLTARQGFTGAAVAMIESALDQHPGQLPAGLLLRLVEHYQQLGRPVDLTRVSWPLEQACRIDPGQEGRSVLDDEPLAQQLTQLWRGENRAIRLTHWLLRPTKQEATSADPSEELYPVLSRTAFLELLELYPLARAIDADGNHSDPDSPQLHGETLERLDTAELSLAAPDLQICDKLIG